jgi:putative restriction endonuclease
MSAIPPTAQLTPAHQAALEWFASHSGQEVTWPAPLNGMFLMNRAKGIHKPAGLKYALSVRQSLNGPYKDSVQRLPGNLWRLQYAQEGLNATSFTNEALHACMQDRIPVGVILQVSEAPTPRYAVLGLGLVIRWERGVFEIQELLEPIASDLSIAVGLPTDAFDPTSNEDARARTQRSIALRQGQPAFRSALLNAYERTCAVTGCNVIQTLEAAHILPYRGDHTNHVQNGLLLRADVHTLFDLHLLDVDPDSFVIRVNAEIVDTTYAGLDGRQLRLPKQTQNWPSQEALRQRLQQRG